jgi:iron complex transport system ATP-binding protein
MILLEVSQVDVWRGQRELLKRVNFTVERGEFVALIGANGAGKSTLLEIMTGDLPLRHGDVKICGRPLKDWSSRELASFRAVMRQSPRLELPFTVEEVVLMGRSPHFRSHESRSDLEICHDALHLVDLGGFASRLYTQLSGGEQRRVQLARTFAQVWSSALINLDEPPSDEPKLLLLDEPTANLDVEAQHRFMSCAQRFAAVGGGVLCVLHDMNMAAQYATRVLVLGHGQILADGAPRDVLTPSILRDAFKVHAHRLTSPEVTHPVIVTRSLLSDSSSSTATVEVDHERK